MLSPVHWFYRHIRQVRLAFILCLIVTYSTLLLGGIPIIAYFDQLQAKDAPAAVSTMDELDLPSVEVTPNFDAFARQTPGSRNSSVRLRYRPSGRNGTRASTVHSEPQTAKGLNDSDTKSATTTRSGWNISKYPSMFSVWKQSLLNACDGRMELFSRQFARLHSVLVDRTFCLAKAHGGEDVSRVLLQDEDSEYYKQMRHCFQLKCHDARNLFGYHFAGFNFLDEWLINLKTFDISTEGVTVDPNFNIAFMRREYANLYHTVNDWYNIFLLMVFFEKRPEETNIVLVDAHPKGKLDAAWSVLFNSTRMLSELDQRTMFTTMVWGMQGYNSVLKESFHMNEASNLLLEEFRTFFLDRFQINSRKQLNCSHLSVLFIWRRDYLAHPRNPTGLVQRKIDNEEELMSGMRSRHPNYTFRGVQIDDFEIKDQLRLVAEADILVGMHGAGLSHTLFVPPHGGLIELVPQYYGSDNPHFVDLAIRRGLVLARWVNIDPVNEKKEFRTRVPVDTMDDLLKQVAGKMCTESQEKRLERKSQLQQRENANLKSRSKVNASVRRWDAKHVAQVQRVRPLQQRADARKRSRARRL